jgi:hypothetical protein
VLNFSKGLELRRQTGFKVRVLVLSKLPAGEDICWLLPAGYPGNFLKILCESYFFIEVQRPINTNTTSKEQKQLAIISINLTVS